MNKQIISLICIAVFLAFGLVMANEKWPDGYRTAPVTTGETTPVGAVSKGVVILPEAKSDALKQESNTAAGNDAEVQSSSMTQNAQVDSQLNAQSQKTDQAPQGELVAIDSGTLKQEEPKTETKEKASTKKQETQAPPAKPEAKPATAKTSASEEGQQGTATPRIRLDGQEAILEITASAPIRCKTFKLSDPNRLVVDLIGTWSVPSPSVPSNLIIQRVRVGDAAERTRIVLDLKKALKSDTIKQIDASTIHIHMR